MLLIMCNSHGKRYAIDSRYVDEVFPRVTLERPGGAPDWFAGMLISRGKTMPVMDLGYVTENLASRCRLGNRIVVLRLPRTEAASELGLLVEGLSLREVDRVPQRPAGALGGSETLGPLCLDEEGIYQLIDIARLVSAERQAYLFPTAESAL